MKKNGKHALQAVERKIETAVRMCEKTLDEIVHDACYTYAESWNARNMLSEILENDDLKAGIRDAAEIALMDRDTVQKRKRAEAKVLQTEIERLQTKLAEVLAEV